MPLCLSRFEGVGSTGSNFGQGTLGYRASSAKKKSKSLLPLKKTTPSLPRDFELSAPPEKSSLGH
jgi:hypothetical protein